MKQILQQPAIGEVSVSEAPAPARTCYMLSIESSVQRYGRIFGRKNHMVAALGALCP
jgi:hypothetical protein